MLAACHHSSSVKRIDIGGYRLKIHCAGKGSPTVVMDSGLGDTQATWSEVLPQVQEFARVCVYDRAGLGRSDPGPIPRTSQRIVEELHALLKNARIEAPYVMVGHSFGGLNVRLYASEHPEEIAGIILVEATHEDYPTREKALRPALETKKIENTFSLAPVAARSEFQSLPLSASEVRSADPLPDVPLIVITAGSREEPQPLNQAWMELQKDLVTRSPQGRQIIAAQSGHYVPFDQPALIVDSIRVVVDQARRLTSALPRSPQDAAMEASPRQRPRP